MGEGLFGGEAKVSGMRRRMAGGRKRCQGDRDGNEAGGWQGEGKYVRKVGMGMRESGGRRSRKVSGRKGRLGGRGAGERERCHKGRDGYEDEGQEDRQRYREGRDEYEGDGGWKRRKGIRKGGMDMRWGRKRWKGIRKRKLGMRGRVAGSPGKVLGREGWA